ncbi:MAG: trehalose-phosphatase [Kofleriaceae bacterium]
MPDPARWRGLASRETLALLLDIDGTLIPFAPTVEQATFDPDLVRLLETLVASGVHIVIATGRPLAAVQPLVERVSGVTWFAEHGAWACIDGQWQGPASAAELDELEATLAGAVETPGARIERKSLALCFHWRLVDAAARTDLVPRVDLACEEWLEAHPDFERLDGIEVTEVRLRSIHKGSAVRWARSRMPSARVIAIGDDVTDEDMFAALGPHDAAIAVGDRCQQTRATAALAHPLAVRTFLHWIVDIRQGAEPVPDVPVMELRAARERRELVVVSNRTPASVRSTGRTREVGGLVSALEPALRARNGIWLGWSGHDSDDASALLVDPIAEPPRASFDLPLAWHHKFYGGFCNRVLWPLFHGFPGRVRYSDDEWEAYVEANEAYAEHALALAGERATIWIHDYHLLLVARGLRRRGYTGPIGLFLHVPFPPRDLFETVPWRGALVEALLDHDLIGFHTARWADNFVASATGQGAAAEGRRLALGARRCDVGVFPIPIEPSVFMTPADEVPDVARLRATLGERRLLLGVDRLDYSKGIPERLAAFERLLDREPQWRGKVSFVQVSVPSRSDIPEYAELRQLVEREVGRINGKFGEADWVPVRYLYRSYDPAVLAQLYRLADVALVTPLRDGMNLVAKEFIAAQDPECPGVLVLSEFAGAAVQMADAVITNPYHPDGLAADLHRALQMPAAERVARHRRLLATLIGEGTPDRWAEEFLARLRAQRVHAIGTVPPAELDPDQLS